MGKKSHQPHRQGGQHTSVAAAWWLGQTCVGFDSPNAADDKACRARAQDDLEWAARQHPHLINDDAALIAAAAHRPGGTGCPVCTPSLVEEPTA
ncbi:hypothetical protein FHX37_0620 [Haloactinospora alba]|uniref:Uncharacterized protein n=1 Tax=Haloactinospora alba TaxID=405555 RepID=A0A543NFV8_9ACTN|nr:hypothetical protein FHX37_0620 [Haloactinospora alba]